MTTLEIVGRLEAAGFSKDQALAILAASEERFVTRDYLTAALNELLLKLVLAMVAMTSVALAIAKVLL